MQGLEDPNVVLSLKVPSIETNPHLKRKRDPCDDSTNSLPAKRTPMITSVSFSSFPSSYWSSQPWCRGTKTPILYHPWKYLLSKPILTWSRRGIPTMIPPIHHPQSERLWSSRLVFSGFPSSYSSSQLWCRGMKTPMLCHPWKYLLSKPILTWSRRGIFATIPPIHHRQSEHLWSPWLVFPVLPLPIWAHNFDAGEHFIILETTWNQLSSQAEAGSLQRSYRFTTRKAVTHCCRGYHIGQFSQYFLLILELQTLMQGDEDPNVLSPPSTAIQEINPVSLLNIPHLVRASNSYTTSEAEVHCVLAYTPKQTPARNHRSPRCQGPWNVHTDFRHSERHRWSTVHDCSQVLAGGTFLGKCRWKTLWSSFGMVTHGKLHLPKQYLLLFV